MCLYLALIPFVAAIVKLLIGSHEPKRATEAVGVKPNSSIPGPKGWPFIGTGFSIHEYMGRFQDYWTDRAKYGPIVKETILGCDQIVLYDTDIIGELARKDGKHPSLIINSHWCSHRRRHGRSLGILISQGAEWKKLRSPWNHTMMKTAKVYEGIEALNNINNDLIRRIQTRRNNEQFVADIDRELFRWSLESACSYLFEKRLGCLTDDNQEAEKFITAVKDMFLTSEKLFRSNAPVWLCKLLMGDVFWRHDAAWNVITDKAEKEIHFKIEAMAKDVDEGVEPRGFLSYVISTHQLTESELCSTVSEIMAAAVDTTSNTTQFILYELSRNPVVQQKVYEEISVVTGGAQPTADHLRKMDYLKATIREVQRLYPVGLSPSRTTREDMTLGGYFIPRESLIYIDAFANGRNPKNFPDPLKLRPERWLRKHGPIDISPLANAVFGFGSRGCVGRKTAETEMQVLITRLLQRFELSYAIDKDMKLCTKTILVPEKPVPVAFIDRA